MTNALILGGLGLFVMACVAVDTIRHRRLHPAFGWERWQCWLHFTWRST
jgi:hypothetical protein